MTLWRFPSRTVGAVALRQPLWVAAVSSLETAVVNHAIYKKHLLLNLCIGLELSHLPCCPSKHINLQIPVRLWILFLCIAGQCGTVDWMLIF